MYVSDHTSVKIDMATVCSGSVVNEMMGLASVQSGNLNHINCCMLGTDRYKMNSISIIILGRYFCGPHLFRLKIICVETSSMSRKQLFKSSQVRHPSYAVNITAADQSTATATAAGRPGTQQVRQKRTIQLKYLICHW